MSDPHKITRQEAIDELRKEAQELEDKPCSFKQVAHNAYKAKIRRQLADKLEREMLQENSTGA